MTEFVVDASVAAKWFLPEEHTDAAVEFLDDSFVLTAPDLLFAEVGNLLWKRVRCEHLTSADARLILKTLLAAPLEIEPAAKHLDLAFDIAVPLDCSVYDCLYLSVAVAHQSRLVTADKKLYETVKLSRLEDHILWVEDRPK